MARWRDHSPDATLFVLLAAALTGWTALRWPPLSVALVLASLGLCAGSFWSCHVLLGARAARIFLATGASLGWLAEQLGSTLGWFFGHYTYTEVLGPRLGAVPLVIPLMWFGLTYIGFIMAGLLLWRGMAAPAPGWQAPALTALLAAMIVTAFDLGADPYFVYVLKAWIMQKTDGDWFGETVRGFEGWMLVSFAIVAVFQLLARPAPLAPAGVVARRAALVPVLVYAAMIIFQVAFTQPAALKVVALFAMGIPTVAAAAAWVQWTQRAQEATA